MLVAGRWSLVAALMHPILLKLGPVTLYAYGAMMVAAFLLVTFLSRRAARELPPTFVAITPTQLVDFTCIALLGGILGARAFFISLRWEDFLRVPAEIPALWHGGLVWYGGFFGGLLGAWGYTRTQHLSFVRVMDQFMPFVALGHAVGRIGCFLNGCCYGLPTQSWCGVIFPGHAEAVLPTQLFEAAGLLALYATLRMLQRPGILQYPGRVFGAYLLGYGVLRLVMEYLRGDQTPIWIGLTLQQCISIAAMLVGALLLFRVSSFEFRVRRERETRNAKPGT